MSDNKKTHHKLIPKSDKDLETDIENIIESFSPKINLDEDKTSKKDVLTVEETISKKKIIRFWRKYSDSYLLRKIHHYLKNNFNNEIAQDFSNKYEALEKYCKKSSDGSGLKSSGLIEDLICEYFELYLDEYEEFHSNESDIKLLDIPLSFKTISGKSIIALDWSVNDNKKEAKSKRDYFETNIMILNKQKQKWWASGPKVLPSKLEKDVEWNKMIPKGIFLISRKFCKKYITLGHNNKTNSLIDSQNLYMMLEWSLKNDLFIEVPDKNKTFNFSLIKGFQET